jgi:hypothetical protein
MPQFPVARSALKADWLAKPIAGFTHLRWTACSLFELRSPQRAGELAKLLCFRIAGSPCHNMSGPGSHDVGLVGRQPEPVDQLTGNGGKGVAVEIAEWGQPMTLTAQVDRLIEPHGLLVLILPETSRRGVTFAGWLVKGTLGLT